jgi:hypothetical protein
MSSTKCNHTDCLWFGRCVAEESAILSGQCYVARDRVQPQPDLKKLVTIQFRDQYGEKQKELFETKAQIVLFLNGMPEPKGLMSIQFHETGVVLTATRSTLVKAARTGELWAQGSER